LFFSPLHIAIELICSIAKAIEGNAERHFHKCRFFLPETRSPLFHKQAFDRWDADQAKGNYFDTIKSD